MNPPLQHRIRRRTTDGVYLWLIRDLREGAGKKTVTVTATVTVTVHGRRSTFTAGGRSAPSC